ELINPYIQEDATLILVAGKSNKDNGRTTIEIIYGELAEVIGSPGLDQTLKEYYAYAFILPDGRVGATDVRPTLDRYESGELDKKVISQ
ncbi:MAG: hypothetical protein AAF551_12450, partial [Bacteroidota bacterium]